jgi:hypothetical protein
LEIGGVGVAVGNQGRLTAFDGLTDIAYLDLNNFDNGNFDELEARLEKELHSMGVCEFYRR